MYIFWGMIFGAVAALIFYKSTESSYKNAGAGSVYSLKQNGSINLRVREDMLTDTRHAVSRGYYEQTQNNMAAGGVGSVGVPGPSLTAKQPTHMPNGRPPHPPTFR